MPYTPTDWVDGVTPLNEANLDKIEQALSKVPYGPDMSTGRVPVWSGTAWANQLIFNGQIDPAAAIAISKLAGYPADLTKFLRGDGTWAVPAGGGGGGGLDWEGAWAAGTAYVKGDVVTYQGVTYGAVNDGTGQTPPGTAAGSPQSAVPVSLVTALPSTPFDGQEIIFVDSLIAPTYQWRFRYVAAKANNKWLFVGGAPASAEVLTFEQIPSTAYGNCATVGPSLAVPLAGIYDIEVEGQGMANTAGNSGAMSYDIGATAAVDADAGTYDCQNTSGVRSTAHSIRRKTLAGGITLTAKYRSFAGASSWISGRRMLLRPVAVGG